MAGFGCGHEYGPLSEQARVDALGHPGHHHPIENSILTGWDRCPKALLDSESSIHDTVRAKGARPRRRLGAGCKVPGSGAESQP